MTKVLPLVSVIIPCYNDAQYIEQSVQSALNQTYLNREVILVDDGSNEETKEVLKKLETKITKLITQENKGQSTARNVGIREAKGNFILVLDSDDYFEPTFCEKAMGVFERDNEVKLITCHANRIVDNKVSDIFKPNGGKITNFLINNSAMGSAIFKKIDWQEAIGYDESMQQGFEDWEFYIRILKDGGIAHVIPEILFNYRLKESSTTTRANKVKYELLNYIYTKHQDLYKIHFISFISHLLSRIEREEMEKIKNTKRIDFKLGNAILSPLRFIKSLRR